ncbi:tuberin-like isoform X2 [Scylla paramamosain]|uniref:tuberin-like isoform X2 n=1 Tax=Scylla paramamosain TaxID=85552 RepID=UPI0030838DEE
MKLHDSGEPHSNRSDEQPRPGQGTQCHSRHSTIHRSLPYTESVHLTMSRERESFTERLKRWVFSGGASMAPTNAIVLTETMKGELAMTATLPRRLHAINKLAESLITSKLEQNGIEQVWCLVRDLLDVMRSPPTCRRLTLRMLTNYAAGEPDIGYMRIVFMKHIKFSFSEEEPEPLFKFFRAVLADGRQMQYVEEEVGWILSRWMPRLLGTPLSMVVLQTTINLIKFHSAYIDDPVVSIYVSEAIRKMMSASEEVEALLCLTLVETVAAYRYLPVGALYTALIGLCRIVNVPHLTNRVVKIVKNVFGTCVGSTAYDMLTGLINRSADVLLVRSAMFFAAFVVCGENRISSLTPKKVDLLRSLYTCLSEESIVRQEVLVLYEVALSLQRLLAETRPNLFGQSWNLIIDIVTCLYRNTERVPEPGPQDGILGVLNDVVNRLEHFVDSNVFEGDVEKFIRLLDTISQHRPPSSVFKVIEYWKRMATPSRLGWIPNLTALIKRYFIRETRPFINLRILDVLEEIYVEHKGWYGHVIVKAVVGELFVGIERKPNIQVRTRAAHLLVLLGLGETCADVEDVLRLLRVIILTKYKLPHSPMLNPEKARDITTAVQGVVKIFRKKTWQPPPMIPVAAYNILVTFLEHHYRKPMILQKVSQPRIEVLRILFSMKCDLRNHLGFSHGEMSAVEARNTNLITPFSPYVVLRHNSKRKEKVKDDDDAYSDDGSEDVSTGAGILLVDRLGKVLVFAILAEKDWGVLEMMLKELVLKLRQKAMVLALMDGRLQSLAATFCNMINDDNLNYPKCLTNTPVGFNCAEFHSQVYPVLAALVAHHRHIGPYAQQKMIRTFQCGVINKNSAQLCIECVTLCVMEMPVAMGKNISRIISRYSKITQCVSHSQAMLEFLSTLLHFPAMYSSFVQQQFMPIFAIAIPYTNPFKFNHYIVSLAYHVIALWFLKCPIHIRKHAAKYITTTLTQKFEYLTATFKPKLVQPEKKRRLSRKDKAKEKERLEEEERNLKKLQIFTDMMETCIDLMSRYAFDYCRPVAERSGVVKMLMAEGKSQTWIAGNKLITITTSGCAGKLSQDSLCYRCHRLCDEGAPLSKEKDLNKIRRHDKVGASNVKVTGDSTAPKASCSTQPFSSSQPSIPAPRSPSSQPSISSLSGQSSLTTKSALVSPTKSALVSPTKSALVSPTKSALVSPTKSALVSPTKSALVSPTKSALVSPTKSALVSPTKSALVSPTKSALVSPTKSALVSPTKSALVSTTKSALVSPTKSALVSPTKSALVSPTKSALVSPTKSALVSPTKSALVSPTKSALVSPTKSALVSPTKSALVSPTKSVSFSPSPPKSVSFSPSSPSSPKSVSFSPSPPKYSDPAPRSKSLSPTKFTLFPSVLPSSSTRPPLSCTFFPSTKPSSSFSPPAKLTLPFTSAQSTLSHSSKSKSLPPSPSSECFPASFLLQLAASSQSLPSKTSPSAKPSFSPTTPQSPSFPFANHPEYSPVHSSPDTSLTESPEKQDSQITPSPQRIPSPQFPAKEAQIESHLLSKDSLYHPLTFLMNADEEEVDSREQDEVRDSLEEQPAPSPTPSLSPPPLAPPPFPPVPEDEGTMGKPFFQSAPPIGKGTKPRCCACWCQGWAELCMRQPCGNFCAVLRFSDQLLTESHPTLQELSDMVMPSTEDVMESRDPVPSCSKDTASAGSVETMHKTRSALGRSGFPEKDSMIPQWEDGHGLSPSFVFLQLYYQDLMPTDDSRPILLPTGQAETQRSISLLDFIRPHDAHKIGVLYVRKGQTTEQEILSNSSGSTRYTRFISALGTYVELGKVSRHVFLGGLDTKGVDGDTALVWQDDLLQVVFHVATMMPTKESDPKCNGKKRHIGNNFVTIVFNESGQPYNVDTIKGQFNHIVIEIVPNHHGTNTVTVHYQRQELLDYLNESSPRHVSNRSLSLSVRQIAVHSNLAAKIMESLQRPPHSPYANNWVERLRHIRKIHSTVLGNIKKSEERYSAPELNDFTDLVDTGVRNLDLNETGQYSIQLMY